MVFLPLVHTAEIQKYIDDEGVIHVGEEKSKTPQKVKNQTPPQNDSLSKRLRIGDTGQDGGLLIKLKEARIVSQVPLKNGNYLRAKEGTYFLETKITLLNESMRSIDIYCTFDFGTALFDQKGRKYDRIERHYNILGNIGCNEKIQPGFSTNETIIFLLPEGVQADYISFWNPNEIEDISDSRWDPFGGKSSVKFSLGYVPRY